MLLKQEKQLTDVHGEDVLTVPRFRSDSFDVEDAPRSGRTVEADKSPLRTLIDANQNLCRHVDVCDLLLKRQENDPILKRIIPGDVKWVVYYNSKRKRS
ncbi:HTH_48 domain-containing protein [Trichonephila clavipes]|nr:HTH_48 domain-containing protein [Trichonephila clavipes]